MLMLFDPRVAWSKPVIGLGAFITLVALGFEPGVQQIILLPTQLSLRDDILNPPNVGVINETGDMVWAEVYKGFWVSPTKDVPYIGVGFGDGPTVLDTAMDSSVRRTLLAAIYSPSDNVPSLGLDPHCSVEACNFTEFRSLEFCTSCEDRTADAVLEGRPANTSLGVGCVVSLTKEHDAGRYFDGRIFGDTADVQGGVFMKPCTAKFPAKNNLTTDQLYNFN